MDKCQAKETLALFRPGTLDETDPSFAEALQMAKADSDLARWFQEHCEAYLVLRGKLLSVPVPADLKERILSERRIERSLLARYWVPLLAAAAAVVLIVGGNFWFRPMRAEVAEHGAYRKRMTETALRSYSMDLNTADPSRVRDFLRAKNAPADYALPAGLQKAPVVGCVVLRWQGAPVSMICFKSGRPLPPGSKSDVWLFVADQTAVRGTPPPGPPVFAHVNKATTASWSDGKTHYLLAAIGNQEFLEKYLQ